MSDAPNMELSKVYDKIEQVLAVGTDTRLEVEKLRGEFGISIAKLAAKLGPLSDTVVSLEKRVEVLEGQSKFNAGRKLAWASMGGLFMIVVNVCIILVKEFVVH